MGAQAVRLSNVDIDNALKNKDFEVLFQPIFDLANGALARMESFVRWRHQSLGVLPPGAFISFFESQGRMSELTRYVLAEALREYTAWRGTSAPGFSINLAFSDLTDESFASHFEKLLRDYDFPAELVTLECPMPPVDVDPKIAEASFSRVKRTDARLAIEVRGRANEFLKTIDPFPFDEIKTGGSAILRFARTVRGPGLSAISDLLDIARRANAAITAVGVEDQASLAALKGLGFTAAQGNHLGEVGDLKAFRPTRVNDVRKSLDLEPFSPEDLAALFRTTAPEVRAPEPAETNDDDPAQEEDDALVRRLNERVARQTAADAAKSSQPKAEEDPTERLRRAAKAKIKEKRAEQRRARKAAAIARAKSKANQKDTRPNIGVAGNDGMVGGESHNPQPVAPHELQDRLSEEFNIVDEPDKKHAESKSKEREESKPPAPGETEDAVAAQQADANEAKAPETEQPPAAEPAEETAPASATSAPLEEPAATDAGVSMSARDVTAFLLNEITVGSPELTTGPLNLPEDPNMKIRIAQRPGEAGPGPTYEPPAIDFDDAPEVSAADQRSVPEIIGGEAHEEAVAAAAIEEPAEEEFDEAPAEPRKRRKPKNFLTRKYRVVPTHFWPKSWKRAWRRRAQARAAQQRAQQDVMGDIAAE